MRNNRASEDIIDAQNRERQERLASKTSYLKSIAFDIESEAKDHNRLLDNVGDDFDSTGNFLSGTLNRVQHMIGSGRNNRKLQCYVVLATIFFIFFIYILSSRLTSASSWTTTAKKLNIFCDISNCFKDSNFFEKSLFKNGFLP